jgi:hypothetical protein
MVPTSTPAIVTFTVFVTFVGFIGPFGSGFIVPLERSADTRRRTSAVSSASSSFAMSIPCSNAMV